MMRVIYLCLTLILLCFQVSAELVPDATIMIPMRDGTQLPTDIYLPSPQAKGLPCILLRSPAGRKAHWKEFAIIAKLGYVVAIQDTRSAIDKEGKTFPFLTDGWGKAQDGYDAVEWLAKSPYTNGKVGTWGSSALGITQLLLAPADPPHLQCQYIIFAAASLYHHAIFPGGQLLKNQAENWLGLYAHDTGVYSYVCQRPFYNEFWKQLDATHNATSVHVPAMHIGGWYDTFLQGTLTSFELRQKHGGKGAKGTQKLVIGPWTHFWPASTRLGDFEIPKSGYAPPYDISPQRWFGHYLKGEENGIQDIPPVIYYVMGTFDGTPSSGNVWRTANEWPVPAKKVSLYLTPHDGLDEDVPFNGVAVYQYNPLEPAPTLGGRNLFLEAGPKDQRPIEERTDVLIFTSDPLEEDVEVTGEVILKLFFTSNQKDTDIVARLTDVYPDGKSLLIADGGYRLGVMCLQEPEKVKPKEGHIFKFGQEPELTVEPPQEEPREVNISLSATSIVFAKGHSIRLIVTGSNYPKFEKNMNVGITGTYSGQYKISKNTLFLGKKYPSQLVLPVVRKGNVSFNN